MKVDRITVGRMVKVHLHKGKYGNVPAKIDTGADSSAIDARDIWIDEKGNLNYILFGKDSPYYSGRIHKTKNYGIKVVTNSTGYSQIRYTARVAMAINGLHIRVKFTLSNRANNTFPILIGARTLKGRFIVDTGLELYKYNKFIKGNKKKPEIYDYSYSLAARKDPLKFYNEVYLRQG